MRREKNRQAGRARQVARKVRAIQVESIGARPEIKIFSKQIENAINHLGVEAFAGLALEIRPHLRNRQAVIWQATHYTKTTQYFK